jgi:hypothetical protein
VKYLSDTYKKFEIGTLKSNAGYVLYPNIILYTKTSDYYIAELFGAEAKFNRLLPRHHRIDSAANYLNQFDTASSNT